MVGLPVYIDALRDTGIVKEHIDDMLYIELSNGDWADVSADLVEVLH